MRYVCIFLLTCIPTFLSSSHTERKYFIYDWLPEVVVKPVDKAELELLARLVTSEDNRQGFESNLVNAQSVINRLERKRLKRPATSLKSVIYQKYVSKSGKTSYAYYGRFNKLWKSGYINPNVEIAAEMILKGYRPAPRSVESFIGYHDPDTEWVRSRAKLAWKKIGYHTYCHNNKSPFYVSKERS